MMNHLCLGCPAQEKAKRKADPTEHECCCILSIEYDISQGKLHPQCPIVAFFRRTLELVEPQANAHQHAEPKIPGHDYKVAVLAELILKMSQERDY